MGIICVYFNVSKCIYKHDDDNLYADTSFIQEAIPFRNADPKLKRLLGFEFKPQAIFSSTRDSTYKFKHDANKWIAGKYNFRTTNLVISEELVCLTLDWNLGDGVHLSTQFKDPSTGDLEDDAKNLYLVFLYRKNGEWNGANALMKLNAFIRHLEKMPRCSVENVYLRATGIEQNEWKHLEKLEYIPNENATTERLLKVYRRVLGTEDWKYMDVDGLPYQKAKFEPLFPKLKAF